MQILAVSFDAPSYTGPVQRRLWSLYAQARPLRCVATLLLAVTLLDNGRLGAQSELPPSEASARRVVADHALAEFAGLVREARGLRGLAIGPDQVVLEPVPSPFAGVQVWHARVGGLSHWRSYYVASVGQSVLRLGGFDAMDVLQLPLLLPKNSESAAESLGRLAVFLDPYGSESVVLPGQPSQAGDGTDERVRRWRAAQKEGRWPPDLDVALADGRHVYQFTSLSVMPGMSPQDVPVVFTLIFSATGVLSAVHRVIGAPF